MSQHIETIEIEKYLLEKLLACLAAQKYLTQKNGDALADTNKTKKVDRKTQKLIDETYHFGMDLLEGKRKVGGINLNRL